jgi:uncharacterized tellurite resistance protein B-like protein
MGLFSKSSNSQPHTEIAYTPSNEQEAWIGIFNAVMSVDGDSSGAEIHFLSNILVFKQMFQGYEILEYFKNANRYRTDTNSKALIDACVPSIAEDNKGTLFALVIDIVLFDGILKKEEEDIIDYIAARLNLDKQTFAKILEVMKIKNKGNRKII